MELDKEIFTKGFVSVYNKASINIIYTYSWLNYLMKCEFDKFDITSQQYNVLRILRGQYPNPVTIGILKERMLDKMSDASRIVDRLVQKGYLVRNVNEKDRRAVNITITKQGLELLEKVQIDAVMKDILNKNLTEEEAEQLNVLLDKFRG